MCSLIVCSISLYCYVRIKRVYYYIQEIYMHIQEIHMISQIHVKYACKFHSIHIQEIYIHIQEIYIHIQEIYIHIQEIYIHKNNAKQIHIS